MISEERVRKIVQEEIRKGFESQRNPYRYIAEEYSYAAMYKGKPVAYGNDLGQLIQWLGTIHLPRAEEILDCRTGIVAFDAT